MKREKITNDMGDGYLKVIHGLPGRLRVEVKEIRSRPKVASYLEYMLALQRGISATRANPRTGRILVHYSPDLTSAPRIQKDIQEILRTPPQPNQTYEKTRKGQASEPGMYELERLPLPAQLGLTAGSGLLLLLAHWRSQGSPKLAKPSLKHFLDGGTVITLLSGIPIFRTALDHLFKRKMSTELLAGTASVATLFLDDDRFGLSILTLVYLNTLIRSVALESVRDRIRGILEGKKTTARVVIPGGRVLIPGEQLAQGSHYEIKPGERFPSDGFVTRGSGLVNQFPVLGRIAPRPLQPGYPVYAGSILLQGVLLVETSQTGEQTRVGRLIKHLKSKKQYPEPKAIRKLNTLSTMALAVSGAYYLVTRNMRIALNMLVLGMPGAAGLARDIPAEIAAAQAAAFGALVKKGQDLAALGAAEPLMIQRGALLSRDGAEEKQLRANLSKLNYRFPPVSIPAEDQIDQEQLSKVVRLIRAWQRQGHTVGFIGAKGGAAPVLAAADVGIVQAGATDLELISAGIILTGDDPRSLAAVAQLARRSKTAASQNSFFSMISSVLGYALGLSGRLTPFWTGLIQNVSTIAILANSSRMLFTLGSQDELDLLLKEAAPAAEDYSCSDTGSSWLDLPSTEILRRLGTNSVKGLSPGQVLPRQKTFGPNLLWPGEKTSAWQILREQLDNYLSKVLLGLSGVSLALGKVTNALMGSGVLLANAALAVLQENHTQKSLQLLTNLAAQKAWVVREGATRQIPARELVPGDIIVTRMGDKVPADARIVASKSLVVEESSLTGEAGPVSKQANALGPEGWVFMGTRVLAGSARVAVVQTGSFTEMGGIIRMVGAKNYYSSSPVYRRLDEVGATLVQLGLGASGLAIFAGLVHRENLGEIVTKATSLAVSVIPDGLLPIITMALALGASRLTKAGVLVRQLPAVDTLGCIEVLCADKTGTLTQNRMIVSEIHCPRAKTISLNSAGLPLKRTAELENLLRCAVLCNNATIRRNKANRWETNGDSTEAALLVTAARYGLEGLRADYMRLAEIPFSPQDMRMTVVCQDKLGIGWTFVKGAPETVLETCRWLEHSGQLRLLANAERSQLLKQAARLSGQGLRALAFAYQFNPDKAVIPSQRERLVFLGFVGLSDPLRPEAKKTVEQLKRAGIQTVMVTGDHANTALSVATRLNMLAPAIKKHPVLTGAELNTLTERQLQASLPDTQVFARLSPRQKAHLIKTIKHSGRTVAMIGDGINDAPSVRQAHVGLTMGRGAAKALREIAPITLTKGGLSKLPTAVAEGRAVYDNIRKCLRYSLTTNLGDGVPVIWATFQGGNLPIEPIQLLWINITSDPFISWVLANDRAHPQTLYRPPRKPDQKILGQGLGGKIIRRSLAMGVSAIFVERWSKRRGDSARLSQTLTMATLTLGRAWHLVDCRRLDPVTSKGQPFNPGLVYVGVWMLLPIWAAIYWPTLQPIFHTAPLGPAHWQAALLGSALAFLADNALNGLFQSSKLRKSVINDSTASSSVAQEVISRTAQWSPSTLCQM